MANGFCTIAGTEPVAIAARATSRRWTYDHVRLEVELATGAHAACDLAYETHTVERVMVHGDAGTLALADPNMRPHVIAADGAIARTRRRIEDLATLAYHALHRERSMARASIATALARFVAATATGAAFEPGFADAARNAAWLDQTHVETGP